MKASNESIADGSALGMAHFINLFKDKTEKYLEKIINGKKLSKVLVCMHYYPGLKGSGWGDAALEKFGYNTHPERLQLIIKSFFELGIKQVRLKGFDNERLVAVPLFEVLDPNDEKDLVQRIEPSSQGGRKIATKVLEVINDTSSNKNIEVTDTPMEVENVSSSAQPKKDNTTRSVCFYLVRHCESEGNAASGKSKEAAAKGNDGNPDSEKNENHNDYGLTDKGHRQALYTAHHFDYLAKNEKVQPIFKVGRIFTSPMKRTLESIAPVADKLNIKPELNLNIYEKRGLVYGPLRKNRLPEENYKTCHGLTFEEMKRIVPTLQNATGSKKATENGWWRGGIEQHPKEYRDRAHEVTEWMWSLVEQATPVEGDWKRDPQWQLDHMSDNDSAVLIQTHSGFIEHTLKPLLNDGIGQPTVLGEPAFQDTHHFLRTPNGGYWLLKLNINADGSRDVAVLGARECAHIPQSLVTGNRGIILHDPNLHNVHFDDGHASTESTYKSAISTVQKPAVDATDEKVSWLKCMQWNILADGLSNDGFQLHEHQHPYPQELLSKIDVNGFDPKKRWLPVQESAQHSSVLRNISPSDLQEDLDKPDSKYRKEFEDTILGWSSRSKKIVDTISASKADVIIMEEVDHPDDIENGNSLKDDYEFIFMPKLLSACRSINGYNALRNAGVTDDEFAQLFNNEPLKAAMKDTRNFDTFLQEKKWDRLVGLLFKSHTPMEFLKGKISDEQWDRINQALHEPNHENMRNHAGKPKYLDDGLVMMLSKKNLEIDRNALDELVKQKKAEEIPSFARDPLRFGKDSNAFPPTPGKVYVDKQQGCLYSYYNDVKNSSFLMVPCHLKSNPKQGVLLMGTHLRSGIGEKETKSRVGQVKQIESTRKTIIEALNHFGKKDPSDPDWATLLGMDSNTEASGDHDWSYQFKRESGKYEQSCEQAKPYDTDIFGYLSKVDGVSVIRPDSFTCMKERGFTSNQPSKRGIPNFCAIDVFVTWSPFPTKGYSSVESNDIKYMMPNVLEPSDHKPITAWIGIPEMITQDAS